MPGVDRVKDEGAGAGAGAGVPESEGLAPPKPKSGPGGGRVTGRVEVTVGVGGSRRALGWG